MLALWNLEDQLDFASTQVNRCNPTTISSMHATLHMTDDINGEWLWAKEER